MRPGTIIYTGKSKKGTPLVVRYPKMSDAKALQSFINKLSKERTFLAIQGKHVSLKEERDWLSRQLKGIRTDRTVMLSVFSDGKLIGNSDIGQRQGAVVPEAVFGITIAKGFRDEGIGTLLMRLALKEAKRRIKGMKIISLTVFANNPRAMDLYRRMGFKKFGILPGGILHRGKYVDHVFMYKKA